MFLVRWSAIMVIVFIYVTIKMKILLTGWKSKGRLSLVEIPHFSFFLVLFVRYILFAMCWNENKDIIIIIKIFLPKTKCCWKIFTDLVTLQVVRFALDFLLTKFQKTRSIYFYLSLLRLCNDSNKYEISFGPLE